MDEPLLKLHFQTAALLDSSALTSFKRLEEKTTSTNSSTDF